jgi:hypothetical protein
MTIHTPGDGYSPRRVTLDGVELRDCVYADDVAGVVKVLSRPYHKTNGVLDTDTLTGEVVVSYIHPSLNQMNVSR